MIRTLLAATAIAGLAAPATAGPAVELSVQDLLAPYYAKLAEEVRLPVAAPNAEIVADTTLSRIAFGSCNHQLRPQEIWAGIAAGDPQLFLLIGDNNYGDQGWSGDAALTSLREAYAVQAASPELSAFRAQVPMMVTWDDHDYGFNDGGASFAFREWSETLFETFWGSSDAVRSRPGVYESRMFGTPGKMTQVVTLDTRFFRSDLETAPYTMERPPLGGYKPSTDPARTMLGEEQWRWLAQELAKPADFRVIVSSIQVVTDAHNYEAWATLPLEREKLYRTLAAREDSGLVILSGDRHAGGIYSDTPEAAGGERIWELTSSSLNYSFSTTERNTAREPDPRRLTDFISEENYGTLDIDWKRKTMTLRLKGDSGEMRAERTVDWAG